MKKIAFILMGMVLASIAFAQAQSHPYTVIGYAGKDTIHVGKATLSDKNVLSVNIGSYRGNMVLEPANPEYQYIREHLMGLRNIRTQAEFESAKTYVSDTLSFDLLYNSGFWREYIQQWVGFYANTSPNPDVFADSFVPVAKKVMERTRKQNTQIAIQLAKDLIEFFEQYGLDKAAQNIAAYSLGMDVKDGAFDDLTKRMLTSVKLLDNVAPEVVGLKEQKQKSDMLLVFYETGCGHCEEQIKELKTRYAELQKKGYRIVTISSDMSDEVYKPKSDAFPWADKLCDLKGFEGENFINYGVASTPTMYLIDKDGIVKGRYAKLSEIKF